MKTKITSMKRAFILFWHGLTALLIGIANWFTVRLDMRDNSQYGKFLRHTVGSCFAFLMLLLTINADWNICRTVYHHLSLDKYFTDSYYEQQYILQRYNHSGEIINDFYINDINYMTYESDELQYSTTKNYNDKGTAINETKNIDPLPIKKMAKCRCYEAETRWYGLYIYIR